MLASCAHDFNPENINTPQIMQQDERTINFLIISLLSDVSKIGSQRYKKSHTSPIGDMMNGLINEAKTSPA
jgi:hypothetical protein